MSDLIKVYVIVAGEGEYSDRFQYPALVLRDKEVAQALMAKLEETKKNYDEKERPLPHSPWGATVQQRQVNRDWRGQLDAECHSAYTALGISPETQCGIGTDWELSEAWMQP